MKPYHISPKYVPQELIDRIDAKWKKLQSKRPLSPTLVAKLRERFMLEATYNSNAIEGNNLTFKETYFVINEGITIKGKSFKNHLEAKSHHEALEFIYNLVGNHRQTTISQHLIRQLQSLVIEPIDKSISGVYRTGEVAVTGATHQPPSAIEVPYLMSNLISWFGHNQNRFHPIELAAVIHHKLVSIHPFVDGNGRCARLLMNIILMQKGYPLVIILKNDRKIYYEALSKADNGNLIPFVTFVARTVERSLDIYLETLSVTRIKEDKFLPLSIIGKRIKFSAKYLNLLARSGKLVAHKEGRNWLTSISSVEDYLISRKRQRN
ncbi:MAG: Fic family protein [Candidatus Woesebacteria bacterium]|nr:Fic family protein [Candidatus Woesebacteria bacterium]